MKQNKMTYAKVLAIGIFFAFIIGYPLGLAVSMASMPTEEVLVTASAMEKGIPGGPRSLVLFYLKHSDRFEDSKTDDGLPLLAVPLHMRAKGISSGDSDRQANAEEVIRILIERGNSVDARTNGLTLLQAASLIPGSPQVSYLLELGADPYLKSEADDWTKGRTALEIVRMAQSFNADSDYSKNISALEAAN